MPITYLTLIFLPVLWASDALRVPSPPSQPSGPQPPNGKGPQELAELSNGTQPQALPPQELAELSNVTQPKELSELSNGTQPKALAELSKGTQPQALSNPPSSAGVTALEQGDSDKPHAGSHQKEHGKGVPKGLLYREAYIWLQAAQEANLQPEKISPFGQSVGKYPASWVRKILDMDHTKTIRFNFQGTGFAKDVLPFRRWVHYFVKSYFGAHDYLRYTDMKEVSNYTVLGRFDQTKLPGGFRPKTAGKDIRVRSRFGEDYFKVMARSKFTLCPRGDRAFSYRLYEAALTRSIPVVYDLEIDLGREVMLCPDKHIMQALRCIGYHVYELKNAKLPLEYREDWAEDNYRLFIKYQTFLEGDNVPPGCPRIDFEWMKTFHKIYG